MHKGAKKGDARKRAKSPFLVFFSLSLSANFAARESEKSLICLFLNLFFFWRPIMYWNTVQQFLAFEKGNVFLSRGSLMQHLCHLYWSETSTEVSWKLLYFPRVHQYPMLFPLWACLSVSYGLAVGEIHFAFFPPPLGNIWEKLSFNWASCVWARLLFPWQPGSSTKRELIKNYLISVVMWRQEKAMHMKL